jgi:hypothetical protein
LALSIPTTDRWLPRAAKDVGIVDAKDGREGMSVPQWRRNLLSHHTICDRQSPSPSLLGLRRLALGPVWFGLPGHEVGHGSIGLVSGESQSFRPIEAEAGRAPIRQ